MDYGYRTLRPKTLTCDDLNIVICDLGLFSETYFVKILGGGVRKKRTPHDPLQTPSFQIVQVWFVCDKNCRRSYVHKMRKKHLGQTDRQTDRQTKKNNIPFSQEYSTTCFWYLWHFISKHRICQSSITALTVCWMHNVNLLNTVKYWTLFMT